MDIKEEMEKKEREKDVLVEELIHSQASLTMELLGKRNPERVGPLEQRLEIITKKIDLLNEDLEKLKMARDEEGKNSVRRAIIQNI